MGKTKKLLVIAGCLIAVVGGYVYFYDFFRKTTSNESQFLHSKEQFESSKRALVEGAPKLVVSPLKSQNRRASKSLDSLSQAETTALVEKSIDKVVKLFKYDKTVGNKGQAPRNLSKIKQEQLRNLDANFSALEPSKTNVSDYGELRAIYPSFELPDLKPKDLVSLGSSTVDMLESHPNVFGLNKSASVKIGNSSCGKQICTTTIEKQFGGLPAWDHSLTISAKDKRIISVLGEFEPPAVHVSSNSELNNSELQGIIASYFKCSKSDIQMAASPERGIGRLAGHDYIGYRVNVKVKNTGRYRVSVNGNTRKVVQALSLIMEQSVVATGTTLNGDTAQFKAITDGIDYYLIDDRFPVGFNTFLFSAGGGTREDSYIVNSATATGYWEPAAVTGINNTKILMDYYSDNHNYDAINSNGASLNVLVDVNIENAYWDSLSQLIVFGSGNGVTTGQYVNSIDVHGHEMTHGVISSTSDLVYAFQSGALNEAFSDFFGTQLDPDDWGVGEDIYFDNVPIRSLASPSSYGQPGHMSEYVYLDISQDNGGVHINSGIPNRAMYLLAEGLTSEGLGVSIGRQVTGQLVWATMTSLSSYATFDDAATQMIILAESIYGSGSPEANASKAAWNAVGLPRDDLSLSDLSDGNTSISSNNSMIYLSPYNDSEGTFNIYVQVYDNVNPSYSPETDFGPLNSRLATFRRPSMVNLENGEYVMLYMDQYDNLIVYDSYTGVEEILDLGYNISDVTLSSDGQVLAFSVLESPIIYTYSYETDTLTGIEVRGPSYSQVTNNKNYTEYVDTLRFDPSSRHIVFDFLTCSSLEDPDGCSQGTAQKYWSIAILDLDAGVINYPFPYQPSSIDLGYPAFSNLTDQYITFDLIDYNSDTPSGISSFVLNFDLSTKSMTAVGFPDVTTDQYGYYGMPSFSADDSGIVFASRGDNDTSDLMYAVLEDYQLGDAPTWLSLNPYAGYKPYSVPYVSFNRDPLLTVVSPVVDLGAVEKGAVAAESLCVENNDLLPIRISSLLDSSNRLAWTGAGTVLSGSERVCGDLTLDTSTLDEGPISIVASIAHDGANSPTALTVNITVDIDTDNDGISDASDADDDNDGLSDDEEAIYGTDPLLSDTDGDGYSDLDEVNGNTNPIDKDSSPQSGFNILLIKAKQS